MIVPVVEALKFWVNTQGVIIVQKTTQIVLIPCDIIWSQYRSNCTSICTSSNTVQILFKPSQVRGEDFQKVLTCGRMVLTMRIFYFSNSCRHLEEEKTSSVECPCHLVGAWRGIAAFQKSPKNRRVLLTAWTPYFSNSGKFLKETASNLDCWGR